jgi:hypothetical protein
MADLPIDYLAAGLLHALYDMSTSSSGHSYTVEGLHNVCEKSFEVSYDVEFTRSALDRLAEFGAVSFLEDQFADTLIRTKDKTIAEFFKTRQDSGDIYWKTWEAELPWLKTAFGNSQFWDRLRQSLDGADNAAEIPASDRIVALDHNSTPAEDVTNSFEAIEQSLRGDNDTGALVGEERAAALEEVSRLKQWWLSAKVRVGSFLTSARATLGWVGEKAASATVGEMAKALLKLLLEFFH